VLILFHCTGRVIWAFSSAHAIGWFWQLAHDRDPFGRMVLVPIWQWYKFCAGAVVRASCSLSSSSSLLRLTWLSLLAGLGSFDCPHRLLVQADPDALLRVFLLQPRHPRHPLPRRLHHPPHGTHSLPFLPDASMKADFSLSTASSLVAAHRPRLVGS
jgi:hypothetical protein